MSNGNINPLTQASFLLPAEKFTQEITGAGKKFYLPSQYFEISSKIRHYAQVGSHPNSLAIIQTKIYHKTGAFEFTEEFPDCMSLKEYIININNFRNKNHEWRNYKVQFAKSVALQILQYLVWLHNIVKIDGHKNISPENIFITSYGVVKVGNPAFATEKIITANPHHYTKNCCFAEPDYHQSNSRSDIWALGVIIYSIMTGKTLTTSVKKVDPYDLEYTEKTIDPPIDQKFNYVNFRKAIFDSGKDPEKFWTGICHDPTLAYLLSACLTVENRKRPDAKKLLSYVYSAAPGHICNNYPFSREYKNPNDAWSSDYLIPGLTEKISKINIINEPSQNYGVCFPFLSKVFEADFSSSIIKKGIEDYSPEIREFILKRMSCPIFSLLKSINFFKSGV